MICLVLGNVDLPVRVRCRCFMKKPYLLLEVRAVPAHHQMGLHGDPLAQAQMSFELL